MFKNTYISVTAVNEKRGHEFENHQGGWVCRWGTGRGNIISKIT